MFLPKNMPLSEPRLQGRQGSGNQILRGTRRLVACPSNPSSPVRGGGNRSLSNPVQTLGIAVRGIMKGRSIGRSVDLLFLQFNILLFDSFWKCPERIWGCQTWVRDCLQECFRIFSPLGNPFRQVGGWGDGGVQGCGFGRGWSGAEGWGVLGG